MCSQQPGNYCGRLKRRPCSLWNVQGSVPVIRAGLFGTEAGDVFQCIDVEAGTLQNVVTFPPEGAFVVNSSISVEDEVRVAFKFSGARLDLPEGRSISLPPLGKGWFDNVWVDDEVRIAFDIRKDVLVVLRDGPPRTF
mmetsp:Transcript_21792/g.37186  ORF Transcript_21792/g.37186 Transcript_21792/m.37186 type:complete len:138 (-) Transcript_21792:798-1211(-)